MPFPDRSFDRVLSTFGGMAAPDQRAMAAELVRVCRPGGTIASTAWSADSVYSKIGGVVLGFLASDEEPDEESGPMPTDWADPDAVRSIFADLPVTVETTARTVTVRWPSTDALLDALPEFGPLAWAVEQLRAEGSWDAARKALTEMLVVVSVSSDAELVIDVPYGMTVATRHR